MAIREVYQKDEPLLRKISKPVKEITPRIRELIQDMKDTMQVENGVGIASPQVGVLKRIFVILDEFGEKKVYINPEIKARYGSEIGLEGCLSVKGEEPGYVIRPSEIDIIAKDENFEDIEEEIIGFQCREFCHEYDHLDGILYTDRTIAEGKVLDVYHYLLDRYEEVLKDNIQIVGDDVDFEDLYEGVVQGVIFSFLIDLYADDTDYYDKKSVDELNTEHFYELINEIFNEITDGVCE